MAVGTVETESAEKTGEHVRTARAILLESALLGVLADGAIRNASEGLGWTLWVLALALAALNVAHRRGLVVTREQVAWLAAAVACSTAYAWRDAEQLRAANVLGTLVALTMFAMCTTGLPAVSVFVARLRDVITAGVFTIRDIVAGAPMVALEAEPQSMSVVRRGASWTALRALLITAPLVLVFVLLLSRADPVFASVFSLPQIDAERLVEHAVVIGAFTWWSAGFVRGALLGTARRGTLPDQMPVRLGLAEITTSLGAVIILFAIFVALQLRWLFGGADVVLATTGLTVAEYARRGFFELVAVAVLVLPLILVTRAFIEDEKVIRRHRLLSLALLVLLAAIITSAMLRMRLYVDYFGLTADRLYATALMVWLGLVFLALARTVFRGWSRPFAAMTVLAGFLTLFALNVVNPDELVARVNLGRGASGHAVDYAYLTRLNGDAMPLVANVLTTASPSPESCAAVRRLREKWQRREDTSWNLGARRGRASVVQRLSPAEEQRLCAGVPATETQSAPRAATSR